MILSENCFVLQSKKETMLNTSENAFYLAHWILWYFLHAWHHCILWGVGEEAWEFEVLNVSVLDMSSVMSVTPMP